MSEVIHCDESSWPIVVVTWPKDFTTEDVQDHIRRLTAYARDTPFSLLYDVSAARPLNGRERRLFTTFFASERAQLHVNCRRVAYVTPHAIHRGVLTAIRWFVTLPFTLRQFAKAEEAWAWLQEPN